MRNIKLILQFDGSAFHGYQMQPNAPTVEEALRGAIKHILHENAAPVSCSRTDAFVHAEEFCCNFRTETPMSCEKLLRALNAVLPPQIAVVSCEDADLSFHARYDCRGKEYRYLIWNAPQRNPFYLDRALHVPQKLDEALRDRAAKDFIGTHDFAAFCAAGSSVKSTVRTIFDCGVTRNGDLLTFSVCGNGFLYNMVRIMVGTLLEIANGAIEPDAIPAILVSKEREQAGPTAKPQGLYLHRVFYEGEENDG